MFTSQWSFLSKNSFLPSFLSQGTQQDTAVDTILSATDRLFSSVGDAPEMVKQARILAQATSQLVNAIKGQAESHPEAETQKRLLAAAKVLADATARMVEAAKVIYMIFINLGK